MRTHVEPKQREIESKQVPQDKGHVQNGFKNQAKGVTVVSSDAAVQTLRPDLLAHFNHCGAPALLYLLTIVCSLQIPTIQRNCYERHYLQLIVLDGGRVCDWYGVRR